MVTSSPRAWSWAHVAVDGFLAQTYGSVPDGAEFLTSDLDAELDGILRDAA